MVVADIVITLGADEHYGTSRNLRVNLSSAVNFSTFSLQPYFNFDTDAFSSVQIDPANPAGIIIAAKRDVILSRPKDGFDINYSAQSTTGETLTGKVVFTGDVDYRITANDITVTLDDCCCLPESIVINIRDFNGGQPYELNEVGANNADAGSITLQNANSNDFNNDFNNDFGATPEILIVYTFNKDSGFWKKSPAEDKFVYTATLNGKTARGTITIDGKDCYTATSSSQPYTDSEFLAQETTYLINQENQSNIFI